MNRRQTDGPFSLLRRALEKRFPARLVSVFRGEALGLPVREKPRVSPAVVAPGQRAGAPSGRE